MPLHPELLLSISPALLRDLVAAPTGKKPAGTHGDLARGLFERAPSKKLGGVLSRIAPFLTPRGRLALHEAAVASSFPAPDALLALPHADVAPTLALDLERTTVPSRRRALRRLFALASLRVARDLPERPTYELLAEPTPAPVEPARVLSLLRRAFGAARLVDAWDARDADGTLRLALFLTQPTETRLTRSAKSKEPLAPRAETSIAVDVVCIAHDGSRVALTLAQPHLLPLYASALSLSLRSSFTLRPLQKVSPTALARAARSTRGLTALDAVGARKRAPDGRRFEARGPECLTDPAFAALAGYIDRVTLRGTTDAAADLDAFLQLPHRVEIPHGAHRAALTTLGIFSPGSLPDDARSLAPYDGHGDWRWRAVLGDGGFDRLTRAKLLLRTQAKHVSSREHRMHGAGYVVRDVPGEPELQYALAEDRALGARLVTAKDRVAWRLDVAALAAAMMRDLGAQPATSPLSLPGVLDLGVVVLASGKLRIVYAMAEPPAGWVEAVRRAAGVTMTPVVLVPKGHAGEARGMLEVELSVGEQLGAERVGRVLGRIAEALGLEAEVEACRRYDEEVVVDLASQRMWVVGVLVTLSDKSWRLVEYLAKNAGKTVTTKEIGNYISRSEYPDVSARKARAALEKQMKRVLAASGADISVVERLIVSEGRLGVRFGVGVRVIGAA
jgi:hypothetical protein